MRLVTVVLSALLLAVLPAAAQNPPTPAPAGPAAPADQRLDQFLLRWEQEMQKIETLAARLDRTEKDTTFNTTQKFVGYAQYMKSGSGKTVLNLASLEMRPEGKPDIHEKFICTGAFLYQFSPAKKEIHAFTLPPPKEGSVAEDNFLSFLFGMKAQEARRRYDMKLVNEDKDYIYVMIVPRFPQDKADFQRARIVLNKDNFLPRQLWFEQPNGSDVTWDIPAIRAGVQVKRSDFDAPTPPAGWKLVQVPRNADVPPKVYRPSGQ